MNRLLFWLATFGVFLAAFAPLRGASPAPEGPRVVYIVPVREEIAPSLVYLVRRGVKEAMENDAALLVIDMNTDGGRVDVTEEIIDILDEFDGPTATYVNDRAFSAGAFISVATRKIYMAPQSVIGAAAPIMMVPGGGAQEMPSTIEAKMTSAVRALVRRMAEKNGYNTDVLEAMIDKSKRLVIDGEVLSEEGEILTLTDTEAAREYGDPPKPLLSSGTVESLDALLDQLGYAEEARVRVEPTGAERLAFWINKVSPILLILGALGVYLEFKTPGFGLPGLAGILFFLLYFFGAYVAGLSGLEWGVLFLVGIVCVILEIFVFPGTIFFGLAGAGLIFVSVVMAMVDHYPGGPPLPTLPQLRAPLQELTVSLAGAVVAIWLASWFLPKTSAFQRLISVSASGELSAREETAEQSERLGQEGVALSTLRPGGKAQFGSSVVNVLSEGELIPRGARVRIIGSSGRDAVVEAIDT